MKIKSWTNESSKQQGGSLTRAFWTVLAVVLLAMAPAASRTGTAHAQTSAPEPPITAVFQLANHGPTTTWDTIILSNNGTDVVPSLYAWGNGSAGQEHSGWPSREEQVANGQSVWLLHPIGIAGQDRTFYILENKLTRKCLMSDTNGDTSRPQVESFPGTGPYCGATKDEMLGKYAMRGVWDLYSAFAWAGPIRSHKTSKCLTFVFEADPYATLHQWNDRNGTIDWCGMSYQNFRMTTKATFGITRVW